MEVMAARKLLLVFCIFCSVCTAALVWAMHLLVEDMEGTQYIITAVSVIGILVTVFVLRPIIMNAPVEPKEIVYEELPQDEDWRNKATRKLILKRKKTIVGSASTIYVFLGDGQGDFVIKGIRCTELGSLKNGEKGEYDIPTESVYIFVLGNKKYADVAHSYYKVPRSDKSVELFMAPSLGENKLMLFSKQDLIKLGKTDGW